MVSAFKIVEGHLLSSLLSKLRHTWPLILIA
jgi:hypothetical protein